MRQKPDKPVGLLHRSAGPRPFDHARYLPGLALRDVVEHYWIVRWDLRGREPHVQEVLPHPSVHLVFERGASRVVGVVTGRFTRVLEGAGRVVGVKFRPGAFYPFVERPIAEFTDAELSLDGAFGAAGEELEAAVLACEDDLELLPLVEQFLVDRRPAPDSHAEQAGHVVAHILAERPVASVEAVAEHFGVSVRTLQRRFRRYVGVSPKWVIQRARLHEAAERLAAGDAADGPQLALEFGYYDQSHFIRDFKALVGTSPGEYARQAQV